jgi:hypothetical protein
MKIAWTDSRVHTPNLVGALNRHLLVGISPWSHVTTEDLRMHPPWHIIRILPPLTQIVSKGFWVSVSPRICLPVGIRPHAGIWGTVPARSEVVAPVHVFCLVHARERRTDVAIWTHRIEVLMQPPYWLPRSVGHIVHLLRSDGHMDMRTLAGEAVFETAPFASVLSVLWPDEMIVLLVAADVVS